jgi:vitamin B12 transporter
MKTILKIKFIFLILLSSLNAQEKDSVKTILSEIIVTATKTETPYYAIGSTVTKISSEEISKRQLTTVVDILRSVPGLNVVQQGGPGKLTNVFMRGSNTNHTAVLVDGVEMNDPASPNNAFDFSSLNTNDIDRIEIIRGPQSTLFGSDAIAGVINIITKQAGNNHKYNFSAEAGSYNYYKGIISGLGSFGNLFYSMHAGKIGSDGISASNSRFGNSEKDKFSNTSLTSRVHYIFSGEIKLDLLYKYISAKTELDQSEKFGDDPNFNYQSEEQLFKSSLEINLLNNKWESLISVSMLKRVSQSTDLADQFRPNVSSDNYTNSQRIKIASQNNFRLFENNLITLGIESTTEKAFTSYRSTSDWGNFDSDLPDQSIRTGSIYLQNQFNYKNSLFFTTGVRIDDNQKFGSVTTYRIASSYFNNTTNTILKLSYGTGFKAPSLFNLFDPAFGNPNLQPETSSGFDIGFEQFFMNENFSFGITYFNLGLKNMFGFNSNFRTINIAKASTKGLEVTSSLKNLLGFGFNFSYTLTETKDEYELSEDYNLPLLRRPKTQFSLIINYRLYKSTNFYLSINYVGEKYDQDFSLFPAKRIILPDYTIINFSASHKFSKLIELTFRTENIFDKQYEEVLYYGTLGRCFYAGIKFDF